MAFSTLGLNQDLISAVSELGYTQPTPIQLEAIPAILNNQDIMAGAQTGTGKTAAFALPILHHLCAYKNQPHAIRALILTPTRELAQQVYNSFLDYGQHTPLLMGIVYGGVSINTQMKMLSEGCDILVATPGRLLDHISRGSIELEHLEYLVLDEADRMLDMGFSDEINRVLKRVPAKRQSMLFSATFDDTIFKLGKSLLSEPTLIEVDERNTTASLVEQVIYEVDEDRKRELVSHLIGARNWHQVLIFTRTKEGADKLSKEMCKDGIKTQAIHGNKSQGNREKTLLDFKQGNIRAMVATDVASRGLDINQLKYVINYELPYNPEDYIHRVGRTGRAGEDGLAISLMSPGENWMLDEIEAILDSRIPQQWLPGYEPDPTKEAVKHHKNTKTAHKKRAKKRAAGRRCSSRRR